MDLKRLALQFTAFAASVLPMFALADTPLGWINNGNMSAYTTTQGELELSASYQVVNGTIDFLNIREDLFASNRRLVGKSGDLQGSRLEAHYGITDFLSVFARHQEHELTVDLGEISSINVLDIDDSLDTTQQEIGFKWMLYEADLLNPNNERSALSLQVTGFQNKTDNFDVITDQITFSNVIVRFLDPTAFSVSNLEDDGWTSRLLFTRSLGSLGIGTVWAGYGESSSTSGTSTTALNGTIRNLFTQDFTLEEEYFYLGASLNFRINARMPVTINYEFIDISNSQFSRNPENPSSQLPGFLSSSGPAGERSNHTLNARVSYWLTPALNLSISGNLFSNQFLGRLPHYNNPLSESFATAPYGFIGAELGYRF
jgi:hypothetical protein